MTHENRGKTCKNEWCDRPAKSLGLCGPCHTRYWRGLDYTQKPRRKISSDATNDERLRFHGWTEHLVVPELGPCWEWNGRRDRKGYGVLATSEKKQVFAHRTAYGEWVGPVSSLNVCHKCDNPPCINPEHLFLGTIRDNLLDMTRKARGNTTKLSPDQVAEIYVLPTPDRNAQLLAKQYGVSVSAIRSIWKNRTWTVITSALD